LASLNLLPRLFVWLCLALSILAFFFYAVDKSAARRGAHRIPENTLHLLALLGGWPGALYAPQLLRHKSVKTSFRWRFWLTVATNVGILVFLLTPQGSELNNQLLQLEVLIFEWINNLS